MESSSSCRARLERQWSLRLFPSKWPQVDFRSRAQAHRSYDHPLVEHWQLEGADLRFRLRDSALLDLGHLPQGRAGRFRYLRRWAQDLALEPPREPLRLRQLWLLLDAALYGDPSAGPRLLAAFDRCYQRHPLLGQAERQQHYPLLAEMVWLAGPLERFQEANPG